jgi:SAM-dependent methyltransferase
MTQPDDKLARSYAYAGTFLAADRVAKYERKFNNRIDMIRHCIEVNLLSRLAAGRLFDCSVGSGRFIPELPAVTSYEGMDYSPAFLDLVRAKYPQVQVQRGDLLQGIPAASGEFDIVLCLRTLAEMANLDQILVEMTRLAKPGGLVVFDYGRRVERSPEPSPDPGPGHYDIMEIAQRLPVSVVGRHQLDSWLVVAVKSRKKMYRLFHHPLNLIPNLAYQTLELGLSKISWSRMLYVLRKNILTVT